MSSSVREAVAGFVAGRLKADQLVSAVTAEYYRDSGTGLRDTLQPLIEVIERAAPGVVELKSGQDGARFEIRLAERRFPRAYEADLRRAADLVLARLGAPETVRAQPAVPVRLGGGFRRIIAALRRLLTASA